MSFLKHHKIGEPSASLDRYRKRRFRWWTIPLFIIIIIVGLVLWYSGIILAAINNATVKNANPNSSQILKNSINMNSSTPVNILLIGVSMDRQNANNTGGNLSDSIMIASIDVKDKTISLLSIPRDLYVKIPGYGYNKINAAHALGVAANGKTGGPQLLEQTITQTLGIPIHYFIRLDLTGFETLVNDVGGVTINVPKAINDPFYPAADTIHYDPFYISAGVHTMNGATALKYARSRETTSDFDRSARQQAIIIAIKNKILTASTLANPSKVTNIINTLGSHILTDFSTSDLTNVAALAQRLSGATIRTFVFDTSTNNFLKSSTSSAGADILIPKLGLNNYIDIKEFINGYFGAPPIIAEKPTITLQQGASGTKAQITTMQTILSNAGFTVSVATTISATKTTTITNYIGNKKSNSLNYLKSIFATDILTGTPSTASPIASPSISASSTISNSDYSMVINSDLSFKTLAAASSTSTNDPLSLKTS